MEVSTGYRSSGKQAEAGAAYQSLIYNIFQLSRDTQHGFAMGVVSPTDTVGTGVLVHDLGKQLGGYPANQILHFDLGFVARSVESMDDLLGMIRSTAVSNVYEIRPETGKPVSARPSSFWHGSAAHRRDCIQTLRERFQYILIDCPPLCLAGDALGVAAMLDGFLMVIEANKTTTEELQAAEHAIEQAGGKLYGNILNKEKSTLPRWAGGKP